MEIGLRMEYDWSWTSTVQTAGTGASPHSPSFIQIEKCTQIILIVSFMGANQLEGPMRFKRLAPKHILKPHSNQLSESLRRKGGAK